MAKRLLIMTADRHDEGTFCRSFFEALNSDTKIEKKMREVNKLPGPAAGATILLHITPHYTKIKNTTSRTRTIGEIFIVFMDTNS